MKTIGPGKLFLLSVVSAVLVFFVVTCSDTSQGSGNLASAQAAAMRIVFAIMLSAGIMLAGAVLALAWWLLTRKQHGVQAIAPSGAPHKHEVEDSTPLVQLEQIDRRSERG